MSGIRSIRVLTDCAACTTKCCSEPFDWVYLTPTEMNRLEMASGLPAGTFTEQQRNLQTGHAITILRLPCRFFDSRTGNCGVYEERPLICRLFPFYPEPLTGRGSLLSAQCGGHLSVLPLEAQSGWCFDDHLEDIAAWLDELWRTARAPAVGE